MEKEIKKENNLINIKYNKFVNKEFKSNPNLKFNSYILEYKTSPGEIAEIFCSYWDGKIYIISKRNNILDIYETFDSSNIHKILSLNKHEKEIKVVRYFIDPKDHAEYLVSADNEEIFIWGINNNFNEKYKIDYNFNLIDCLLLFSNDKIDNNYIFISNCTQTHGMNCYISQTKMYSFNNQFIKNLESVHGYFYHLLLWHDKIKDIYYIVILTNEYISIYNLIDGKLFKSFLNYTGDFIFNTNANKADHAYIYQKDNNYYLVDLNYNTVTIWDLYNKCKFKSIELNINIFNKKLNESNPYKLKHLVKWNNKYAIVINKYFSNHEYSFIQIVDLVFGNIITRMGNANDEKEYVRFIKTIIHPIFGESLLMVNKFTGIQLWTTKNN